MLRLRIESIDDPLETDALIVNDLVKNFQRKVADNYTVVPIISCRAYEDFVDTETGAEVRITHRSFGRRAYGSIKDLTLIDTLLTDLWGEVKLAFPKGETVIWRRLPEVTEYFTGDECPRCHCVSQNRQQVKVTFRLGCSKDVMETNTWIDGEFPPLLGEHFVQTKKTGEL